MVTGLAAIGSMVMAGSVAAATTVSFATVAVGVVTSALVGAAIGGLTAAITGGDIGKGLLFGAIGGVVTGGLTGGMINQAAISGVTSSTGAGTLTPALLEQSVSGGAFIGSTGTGAGAGAAAAGGGGSLFGGAVSSEMLTAVAPMAMDAIKGGLAEDPAAPQQDFAKTKEGFYAALKSAEKRQEMAAGAAAGHAPPVWASTEAGVTYQKEQDYKQLKEQGAQKLREVEKTYKMANENAASEFNRGREVYNKAAGAAAGGEYHGASEAQKEAIIASQAPGSGAGMLKGADEYIKPEDR